MSADSEEKDVKAKNVCSILLPQLHRSRVSKHQVQGYISLLISYGNMLLKCVANLISASTDFSLMGQFSQITQNSVLLFFPTFPTLNIVLFAIAFQIYSSCDVGSLL